MNKYIKLTACASLFAFTLSSCDGLFKDAPIDKLSEETIWENDNILDGYVLPWYRNMSNGFDVQIFTSSWFKGKSRFYMPWLADQVVIGKKDMYRGPYSELLAGDNRFAYSMSHKEWLADYNQIQSVNRLLQNSSKIDGKIKERVMGEGYFFRAYYYYRLFREFGGVLLINNLYNPLNESVKFPRASYEEMVAQIADDATKAAELLPAKNDNSNTGRITKGAALMLKAKAYMWASADRFQNQEEEFMGFTDNKSAEMIQKAIEAYNELMGLKVYSLMPAEGKSESEIAEAYTKIFLTKNSSESILEVQHSNDGDFSNGFGHKLDRYAAPPSLQGTWAMFTPTQNHVDEYDMRDGKAYDKDNPYANRDYRFYANILYDGAVYAGKTLEIHTTIKDGKKILGKDLQKYGADRRAGFTQTGYYMRKFLNPKQKIDEDKTYGSSQDYIIWRYAEALLDYAELNFRAGNKQEALNAVNQIRKRVHMDELTDISLEKILHERRVELAFEESTYWDIYRLGIADKVLSGKTNPLKKMEIIKEDGKPTIYKVSNLNDKPEEVRVFNPKYYYRAIPFSEVKYHDLKQNPEWKENE